MESLSRSFHTRKLSNASNFSGKNAYDGVFSLHRRKYAGVPVTNVQDYREIFGNSQAASSIPVLDLSTLEHSSDASSLSLWSSKPDYGKIFGGFRDEDAAVSYEELFARDGARAPLSTRSTSQDSDDLSDQSFDALKQFNMLYHKINQRSKDGLDGTTHVAKLHAVPGFTCFINETAPPQKMEAQKHKSVGVDSSKEGFSKKQLSGSAVRSKHHNGESFSEDNLFKTFEINPKSPSVSLINADKHKNYPKRSTATDTSESAPEEFLHTYFDEELDVNSAAAASAAALKKAIEKAQESIRIAKESVGRKKKGLRSFSSKTFKDSLKVEGKKQDVIANEEPKAKDDEVRGTFERDVFSNFMDSEKLFVAKKVIDEINGKISESAKRSAIPTQSSSGFKDNTIVSNSKQVIGEIESRNLDSAGNHEYATRSFVAADTEQSRNVDDQRNSMPVDDYEGENKLTKPTTRVLEELEPVEKACEQEKLDKQDGVRIAKEWEEGADTLNPPCFLHEFREIGTHETPQEDGASAQRPKGFFLHENCDKKVGDSEETVEVDKSRELNENKDDIVKGSNNLIGYQSMEDEKKAFQDSNQTDIELSENEKQEEVHEQEPIEKVENTESHIKRSDDEKGLEEASQWLESENETKSSSSSPETHKQEEVGDMFYDVSELETNETAQTRDISVEESQVTLKDDYVMKQEDNHTGKNLDETYDQEFDENSSSDDNDMEEEEELSEKISTDQTASDDNEDELEVKSDSDFGQNETEENDARSDESKKENNIIREEGESNNIQLSHKEIPKIRSAEESKVAGKEQQRKIDELIEREKENTKNRLAVDRAIREARERAFSEARERAERAAVEKATAEVRERIMADAREKIAKTTVGAKSSFERTSAQSKLRAERAAVERATSEARQRALEKAMFQKSVSEAGLQVNRESSSSSDLHSSNGTNTESALRSKAKLEKHNRIMERAAKALAEKEKRDLLAQKEQAERNRLAENLDADIKRWSSGKERNLRALLSTLQYILGPDSGWQPISLTEIITTSAVKKAYRKATLCVHPDKLQQRGASIQHKYICEKVFDLLKAAWNRFNSEER